MVEQVFDLVSVPVTDWDTAAVLETFGARPIQGRARSDDRATWVTVPGGEGYLRHRHPDDASRGAPEVVAVTLPLDGWTYADALDQIVTRCGLPATMGGAGPWLCWRTADLRQIRLDCGYRDKPLLHLEHAAWEAEDQYRSFSWGEIDGAPYQWRVDLMTPPDGTWFPGGFELESLEEFETQLGEVCESLAHAATLMPDSYLQAVNVTVLRREQREDWVQFYATADRLSAKVRGSWQELGPGKPEVEALVGTLVAEIRSWDVEPSELTGGGYITLALSASPMPIAFTTLGLNDDQ